MEVNTLEEKILDLLNKNLMSVSQVARALGIRKDVAAAHLEALRQKGKLELFVVGKSNVYTVPRSFFEVRKKRTRAIGIVSGKGGVGKTVVTINLSAALMNFGKKVIAVDADIKMSGLGLQLGMYYFPTTLNDVIKENANVLSALYIHPTGLRIIPASLSLDPIENLDLSKILNSEYFENCLFLVDSPPGLEKNTYQILNSCDEVIFVTLPEIPAVADIIKIMEACKETRAKPLGIIVNRYNKKDKSQVRPEEIESACNLQVLGTIPEDKTIRKSIFERVPAVFLNPYSSSSIAFKKIAAKILGFNYSPPPFYWIKRFLRLGK